MSVYSFLFPQLQPAMSRVIHIPLAWRMLWTPIERGHVQTDLFSGSLLSALMQLLRLAQTQGQFKSPLLQKVETKTYNLFSCFVDSQCYLNKNWKLKLVTQSS